MHQIQLVSAVGLTVISERAAGVLQLWETTLIGFFFSLTQSWYSNECMIIGFKHVVFRVCVTPQDDYVEALGRLHLTVSRAYRVNPEINFEVFIHKVDGLSDDHKIETQRDIHQRANDDLADASLEKLHLRLVSQQIFKSTAYSCIVFMFSWPADIHTHHFLPTTY